MENIAEMKADACLLNVPRRLVFITTLGCTARCRDCCFSASPTKAAQRLSARDIKDASLGLPITSVHPCESCLYLYHSPLARSLLLRHYKEVEWPVVEKFMTGLAFAALQRRIASNLKGEFKENASGKEASL